MNREQTVTKTDYILTDYTDAFASGEICRIGGMALTQRALDLCAFAPAARIADIGCGKGATVRYLRALGFKARGLDCDAAAIRQAGPYCQTGDAIALPYADISRDGLFYECSLSQMDALQALSEAQRVLRPGGKLAISDLYAQNTALPLGEPLLNRNQWLELCISAGFSCLIFEDRSKDLQELTAQLLWKYGRGLEEFYECAYDPAVFKAGRCGYFLLIAQKEG